MKTSLEEARKRATPTPWRIKGTNTGNTDRDVLGPPHPMDGGDYASLYKCGKPEDALYSAHCANHFNEVVKALEDMLFQFDGTGYETDEDRECIERAAAVIERAKTVEML